MATKAKVKKINGIHADGVYTLREFMGITGISRQMISVMRRNGLVVRDTGVPTILGSDWVEFCKTAPQYRPQPRGKHAPAKPIEAE